MCNVLLVVCNVLLVLLSQRRRIRRKEKLLEELVSVSGLVKLSSEIRTIQCDNILESRAMLGSL